MLQEGRVRRWSMLWRWFGAEDNNREYICRCSYNRHQEELPRATSKPHWELSLAATGRTSKRCYALRWVKDGRASVYAWFFKEGRNPMNSIRLPWTRSSLDRSQVVRGDMRGLAPTMRGPQPQNRTTLIIAFVIASLMIQPSTALGKHHIITLIIDVVGILVYQEFFDIVKPKIWKHFFATRRTLSTQFLQP